VPLCHLVGISELGLLISQADIQLDTKDNIRMILVRFQVFMATGTKMTVSWHAVPCDLVDTDISEELTASIIMALMMKALSSSMVLFTS
jgi:hypothetical protein